ncbi:MAG: SDR family NAD(P)-dependent oxidoreductase, partial [Actinobacteria bacterium]|nr:SDR family NAD(P)-dependent oxidoreductase [Actinomycetota bacterium]
MALGIDLSGKVALVTGAGRGIGRAIALSLAQAGADVCVTARTGAQIAETADLVRRVGRAALAVPADATDAEAIALVVDHTLRSLGGLHVLVNNAGTELAKPLLDTSEDEYARVMDTNVKSCFLFTKAVGPHLIAQQHGRIVNVSTVYAIKAPYKHVHYAASKVGLLGFTRAAARELAPY